MKVLIGCEFSGVVRDAFIKAGHDCISADLLPTEKPGPHYQGDVRDILGDGFDLAIFHPPCTRLANSGVRWLHNPPKGKTIEDMQRELIEGAEFYNIFRHAPIKHIAVENPVMHKHAKELIGPVDRQLVQPWWFGEKAFKATGFELINLPDLIPTDKLIPPKPGTQEHKEWSKIHRMPPGPDRWKERSRTFTGIAEAMADQWGNL